MTGPAASSRLMPEFCDGPCWPSAGAVAPFASAVCASAPAPARGRDRPSSPSRSSSCRPGSRRRCRNRSPSAPCRNRRACRRRWRSAPSNWFPAGSGSGSTPAAAGWRALSPPRRPERRAPARAPGDASRSEAARRVDHGLVLVPEPRPGPRPEGSTVVLTRPSKISSCPLFCAVARSATMVVPPPMWTSTGSSLSIDAGLKIDVDAAQPHLETGAVDLHVVRSASCARRRCRRRRRRRSDASSPLRPSPCPRRGSAAPRRSDA